MPTAGDFEAHQQWTDEPRATVTKRPRQEEQRTWHIALEKLDLRLGDPIDTNLHSYLTDGGHEFVYNDGRGVTRSDEELPY